MKVDQGKKKEWVTPKLIVHGDVEKITTEGQIPPKVFGAADGAIWSGQSVTWSS